MVDRINAYVTGLAPPPYIKEGGAANEEPKVSREKVKAAQAQTINNILRKETKGQGDFVSQAEAILNKALSLKSANIKLSIDVDDNSGLFVYKGVDKLSGEIISQYPAKEILSLIAFYRETEGLVVDKEA